MFFGDGHFTGFRSRNLFGIGLSHQVQAQGRPVLVPAGPQTSQFLQMCSVCRPRLPQSATHLGWLLSCGRPFFNSQQVLRRSNALTSLHGHSLEVQSPRRRLELEHSTSRFRPYTPQFVIIPRQ